MINYEPVSIICKIGLVSIYGYSLMLSIAFIISALVGIFHARRVGMEEQHVIKISPYIIAGSFLGSVLSFEVASSQTHLRKLTSEHISHDLMAGFGPVLVAGESGMFEFDKFKFKVGTDHIAQNLTGELILNSGKATTIWEDDANGVARFIIGVERIDLYLNNRRFANILPTEADTATFYLYLNFIGKVNSEGKVLTIENVELDPNYLARNNLEMSNDPDARFDVPDFTGDKKVYFDAKEFLQSDGKFNGPVVREKIRKEFEAYLQFMNVIADLGNCGSSKKQSGSNSNIILSGWIISLMSVIAMRRIFVKK